MYGYALDERGAIVDMVALALRLDLAKLGARVRESGLQLHTSFGVSPGKVDLRFLVRDGSTGRMGSRRLGVVVPTFASGSVVVSHRAVAETDGFRRFVLKVTPAGVPAGDYTFRVRIKDPLSSESVESAQVVRVE